MKIIISIVITILVLFSAAFADNTNELKNQTDLSKQESITFTKKKPRDIAEEFGPGNVKKMKLDDNGVPTLMYGNLNKGITETDPLEKCYQFFGIHKELFHIDNPREEFIVKEITNREKYTHIRFNQVYNNIRVDGNAYDIDIGSDGAISYGGGYYSPEARFVDTTPLISEEQAKQIAVNDPHSKGAKPECAKSAELVITDRGSEKGEFRLVWIIEIENFEGIHLSSAFYIDAKTGKFLKEKTHKRGGPARIDLDKFKDKNNNNEKDDKNDNQDK